MLYHSYLDAGAGAGWNCGATGGLALAFILIEHWRSLRFLRI